MLVESIYYHLPRGVQIGWTVKNDCTLSTDSASMYYMGKSNVCPPHPPWSSTWWVQLLCEYGLVIHQILCLTRQFFSIGWAHHSFFPASHSICLLSMHWFCCGMQTCIALPNGRYRELLHTWRLVVGMSIQKCVLVKHSRGSHAVTKEKTGGSMLFRALECVRVVCSQLQQLYCDCILPWFVVTCHAFTSLLRSVLFFYKLRKFIPVTTR